MSTPAAAASSSGLTLKLRVPVVKQEPADDTIDLAAMEDEEEAKVKEEPLTAEERRARLAAAGPPPPPPVKGGVKRPGFSLDAPGAAASSSSSAAAAASSSSAAAPAASAAPMTSSSMRSRLKKRPKSILDYLCSLDRSVLDSLYTDPFTCLTIFRSLHPLAKQYLLRWLFIQDGVHLSVVDSWIMATPNSQQAHAQAMATMWELQLLLRGAPEAKPGEANPAAAAPSDADPLVFFNPPFQKCLQDALSNKIDAAGLGGGIGDAAADSDPDRPDLTQLENYAQEKWDGLLHWMVGASRASAMPSSAVTSRLVAMGLMQPAAAGSAKPLITPSGFAFLFKDVASQVWDVVLAYMDALDELRLDRDQVLQFLFRLSFLKLGNGYSLAELTDTQRRLLHDLTAFGLIYVPEARAGKQQARMYYPTRLALNLSSSAGAGPNARGAAASSGGGVGGASAGYLILETTFRLYAFTTSPFHTALLGLFCRLDIALPNLLVCTVTKESVRGALKANISSAEIISYLETYAKDELRQNTPVLPENVVDQIRLWEAERNRMALQESYLFEFDANDTEQVMGLVLQEAFRVPQQILLHHPSKKLLVTTTEGYARLKAFKLDLNARMAAAAGQMKRV